MAIAHDNLARWSLTETNSKPYSDAWREILERPLEEVLTLMLEESGWMTAMRHTSPFAGILSNAERQAIFEQFQMVR
jgi:hypothetical protein